MTTTDLTSDIIAYEQGELDSEASLQLFAGLVKSGIAWKLQGSYRRTAADLIRRGLLTEQGEITAAGRDMVTP